MQFSPSALLSTAHIHFDIGHTSLQFNQLHIEGSLLASKRSCLLLQATVLGLLVGLVSLHFLLNLKILISEGLAHLLCLEGDHVLQGVFLTSEYLHLFFMKR